MNDQAPGTALAPSAEAAAEGLLTAFLGECPPDTMPVLRHTHSFGNARSFYQELLALVSYVAAISYADGTVDGYIEGRAAEADIKDDYAGERYE